MRIQLRPWEPTDAAALAALLSDRRVQDRLRDGLPYPYTEEDGRAYIAAMLAAEKDDTFAFAVTVEGRVVGNVGAFRQGNIHRCTAELGYYLAREYWGRGIMTEAVRQLCAYVFAETDILRIFAEPFADNIGSCRVLEKAGFSYEGTLRGSAVKNGRVLDMRMYARLKGDAADGI